MGTGHSPTDLQYKISDVPPITTTIFLSVQQYLVLLSSIIGTPFLLATVICSQSNAMVNGEILGNLLVASGIGTMLQSIFGARLPIIQCPSFTFIVPMMALVKTEAWKCPESTEARNLQNSTQFAGQSEEEPIWQTRLNMLTGTVMVACFVEFVIGITGCVGILLRFVGPLTVAPTLMLIGLSLTYRAVEMAGTHWGIAVMLIVLVILLSECIPIFTLKLPKLFLKSPEEDSKGAVRVVMHKIFSVLIAVGMSWLVCWILTTTDSLPSDDSGYGYKARTDLKLSAISEAPWFRFPYPGQYGFPVFSPAMFIGLIAGVLTSIIESIGDYYACARLSGAPPPPEHAVNRGIALEGLGSIIAGAVGGCVGVTSCSQNIGVISLTKVGSRRVAQLAGLLMFVCGCLGKFAAVLVSIPEPIIGGNYTILFGIIAAVGVSNLQYVNMNSSRNLLVFGMSLFCGMAIPGWANQNAHLLKTGTTDLDHVISVLLGTDMFVGCMVGFVLDNLMPGSPEDRGIMAWRLDNSTEDGAESSDTEEMRESYDLPFIQNKVDRLSWAAYVPIFPNFRGFGKKKKYKNNIVMEDLSNTVTENKECTCSHL